MKFRFTCLLTGLSLIACFATQEGAQSTNSTPSGKRFKNIKVLKGR